MDWVDALHETPDLCGKIEVLDYRAIFIGRYSCVYKGRMKRTDELVAIKVLNPIRGIGLSTLRRKIERERKTWSSLRHPNILPLYGFADDHRLFTPFGAFISPWRARGDLGEFLIEEGEKASLKVRLHLWHGVVAGVRHLHSHQPLLVHGDLKPGNVLINNDGHAQLCDFGLVRVYLKEGHSGMTTASPHYGTERYLSWELVMEGEDAIPTAASDIYATGCIGLETLFLEKPYSRHVTNVRWHMMTDMHAGNPPSTRPTNLVGQIYSLWEIISRCWELDPHFRPHARVLCTQVAELSSVMDFEDEKASHWPETRQPSGPRNPHDQLPGGSTVQLPEDEQSGDILLWDHDISNLITATPSSNGYYDHLSDLNPAINIHEVGIRGNERVTQGSKSNTDLGCTDIEEECSSAAYADGTSLSTSGPIVEAPGTILCEPALSDTPLKSIITPPAPPRSIVAENATEEQLKFASVEPEISRRMHVPPRWDPMPVWDSPSQLKDRGMLDADLEKIEAVAPAPPYPFIDAGRPRSKHLASPPKIEDVVFSSNGHFGSGMNTSTINVYPVASTDTKPLPFDSLAAYRDPDSGMAPKLNRNYVKQPKGPSDYGLSSAQSSKNTDVAEYPSVIPNPSVLRRESGAEISNPISQSQPDILSRGSGASFQRRPLPKLPGDIVHQSSNAVESMNPLTWIPAVSQITLTQEGYPSGQSVSEMGHYFRHSRELSGGPSLSPPATTYVLPDYRRSVMSRNLSKLASPPTSPSTSHSPARTAPTSGSLASTPITEGSYGALDENPDSNAQASTRGRIVTNLRSRARTYSSLALAARVLIEPAKLATRRIRNPISLRPNSSGCMEDHTASFMGTNLPKSPVSPVIPASNSFATPRTHHISTPPCSRAAYLSNSPIATEQLVNPQLSPASRIPSPPRNSARLHATAIEPNTAESNNLVGEQRQQKRGGVFSLLRLKRFSTVSRSGSKSLRLPLSETPPPFEPVLFISRYSKEQAISDASVEALIGALEEGGHRATRYSPSCDSAPLRRRRASIPDVVQKVDSVVHHGDEYHREAEVIRRKTTLYTKKKKGKETAALGGWKEVSDARGATGKQGNLQFNEFGERKTYGYVGTPNETVVGSTTHLVGGAAQRNTYGFPKHTESDDGSTERASSLHGGPEFGYIGKGGRVGRGSHSRSRSASREALPLLGVISSGMGMASTSSLGDTTHAPGIGHANHRLVPSLELNRPPRLDSSGIITASPSPMTATPGQNIMRFGRDGMPPRMVSGTPLSGTPLCLSVTPPAVPATPPRIPSTPPTSSEGFSPFPFVSFKRLERECSLGGLSMESQVLALPPTSFVNFPQSRYPPHPMENIVSSRMRRWEDPAPTTQRVPNFNRPPASSPPPLPPPPNTDASWTLPVLKSPPMARPLDTSFTLTPQPSSNPPWSTLQEITFGFRSSSPGVSFDPPDLYRKEVVNREVLGSGRTSHTTFDPHPRSSSPIRSIRRENGSWDFTRIHNAPPTQVVDQDERKEVCTVCHITIRAQNMERHKRSRHPNHFA